MACSNGESWAVTPLDSDRPKTSGKSNYGTMQAHGVGGCETAAAPTKNPPGGVRVFIRDQNWAATAWTTFSSDFGATWRPLSRGAFPVFGGASATTTASGVMIVGPTREPHTALRVSFDNGASFRALEIDTPSGASGGVAEVAPNLVMVTYDSYDGPDTASVQNGTCSFGKPPGLAPSCIPRFQLIRISNDPPDVYPVVVSGL